MYKLQISSSRCPELPPSRNRDWSQERRLVQASELKLAAIVTKTTVVHTVTYFVAGALAYAFFDYQSLWDEPVFNVYMRRMDDPVLMAGPIFQPIRGVLFGLVFYLLRREYFGRAYGWLTIWAVLVVVGMLSTFGPAPGSIEGLIYTTIPFGSQFGGGSIETLAQALTFSFIVFYWVRQPEKRWMTWMLAAAFLLVLAFSIIGILQ